VPAPQPGYGVGPGGIGKELYASQAQRVLDRIDPATPAEQARLEMARELLDDIRVLDGQLKESHRRIRVAVKASGTRVTDLFGVGPIIACYLIGFSGDVIRFANRDAYAAYNGTAPVERSSGGRVVHRVSQRGNRKLNHALHIAGGLPDPPAPLRTPADDGLLQRAPTRLQTPT
jgi:transposase